MRSPERRPWLLLAPALAGAGAAAWLLVHLGGVLVHQCVDLGAAGWVGLRLALLRSDLTGPSGTLAVGGEAGQVVGVVVVVALPLLVVHTLAAIAGLGALTGLRRAFGAALTVLVRRPRRVLAPVAPVVGPRPEEPVDVPSWSVVTAAADGTPWRRGPPVLALT